MLDHIIYGAIGFLLGGVLGGAVVGRLVVDDMKKRLDEVEEHNRRLSNELAELKNDKTEQRKEDVEKLEKETKLDEYESLRKRYVSASATVTSEESDDEDDEEAEGEDEEDDPASKIIQISEQRYNEEVNYRDHEELTYFQLDGVMIDSAREVVIKEEEIVGSDIMDIIDDTKNDYLYAFDEEIDKLYEITIEHDEQYFRDYMQIGDA